MSASKDAAERAVGTRGRQTTGDDQLRRREPRTVSYQASGGTWSPERVAAAMQDWSQLVGQPPRIPDWCPREHFEGPYLRQVWERHYPRWPEASTVKHHFGTWREGLIAAGLPVDRPPLTLGLQERIAAARSMRDQGLRQVEIAAELGAHPSAVGNYLRAHLCDCDQRYVVVGRRCSPCANQRAVAGRVDQGERAGGDSGAGASSKAGSRPASSGGRTATRVSAGGGSTPRGPPLTR